MELTRQEDLEIKVVTLLGQVVYGEKVKGISGKYQKVIDLNGNAGGIYTLQLLIGEGMINKKVVIQ